MTALLLQVRQPAAAVTYTARTWLVFRHERLGGSEKEQLWRDAHALLTRSSSSPSVVSRRWSSAGSGSDAGAAHENKARTTSQKGRSYRPRSARGASAQPQQ